MSISVNISAIRSRIEAAKSRFPLAKSPITLLGASKGQGESLLIQALAAGLTTFGENKVQEAEAKWPSLRKDYPNLRLHLIGPLQTNKVKEAMALFDVIQTLDRPKLADEIAKHYDAKGRSKEFYIQVNTGKEPQKAGVIPEEADDFIEYCVKKLALPVVGLMCVPPAGQPPAPHFALLREIAGRHSLKELSMGMSEDFETAIRMGSTCVRIGRALFGERN